MASSPALSLPDALAMLSQCFMEPADQLTPDRSRESIPGWDSMGALMFIAELDERFGLELTAEVSAGMTTVADALDFLRAHGALQA